MTRDRSIDAVRSTLLVTVVALHAMMVGVSVSAAGPVLENAMENQTWFAPASWVVQVMPLFFIVGGFASITQWRSLRAAGVSPAQYVRSRIVRLVRPAIALVAVTGAPADIAVDGVPMRPWEPFWWPAGTELTVTSIRLGMRVYLAVHGELQVPRLLGSCAPDSVLGFSGPLNRGDSLEVQPGPLQLAHCPLGIPVLRGALAPPRLADHLLIPVTDGPDRDQFGASAERLHAGRFVIGDRSNHIGLRLRAIDGAELPVRGRGDEVLSRGVPIGAVEVPAGDELMILHRGRGVTAGYPVLAVVTATGLSRLGQARPGQSVSFARVPLARAVAAARAERAAVDGVAERAAGFIRARGGAAAGLNHDIFAADAAVAS